MINVMLKWHLGGKEGEKKRENQLPCTSKFRQRLRFKTQIFNLRKPDVI